MYTLNNRINRSISLLSSYTHVGKTNSPMHPLGKFASEVDDIYREIQ